MSFNSTKYTQKLSTTGNNILVDVLQNLLVFIQSVLSDRPELQTRVESILQPIVKPVESKVVSKKKPPPKKKAPAPKDTDRVSQVWYYPLFWVPTTGPPCNASNIPWETIPIETRDVARLLQIKVKPISEYLDLPARSVYEIQLPEELQWKINLAVDSDTFLDRWFKKISVRNRKQVAADTEPVLKHSARPSLVPAVYSQRLGILIYALKKAVGLSSKIQDVELAILNCNLGQNEVSLLSETLVEANDSDELKYALINIKSAIKEHSLAWLYEDERFLYFTSLIPNVRERMCCLYVSMTFRHVSHQLETRMRHIITALGILTHNTNLHFLHQLVLRLGNSLNTGSQSRSNLGYFRMSTFSKLADVKGNEGMALVDYVYAFTGTLWTPNELKFLNKASQFGVVNTFNAARDLMNTYMVLAGLHTDNKLMPCNAKIDYLEVEDSFEDYTAKAADDLLNLAQQFALTYLSFVATYTAAAFFFGDPNSLLPLDTFTKSEDDDDGPSRDMIQRYCSCVAMLQSRKKDMRIDIPSFSHVNPRTLTSLDSVVGGEPVCEDENTYPGIAKRVSIIPVQNHPNALPEKKTKCEKILEDAESSPFAPGVQSKPPLTRGPVILRPRIGGRLHKPPVLSKPSLAPEKVCARKVRTSISNSYNLARDLNDNSSW